MYLLNEKIDNTSLKYATKILKTEDADFIILDDNTYKNANDINEIAKEIEKFGYNVKIINIEELMENLLNFIKKEGYLSSIDTIVCVGAGGKQAYEALLKKSKNQIPKLKYYSVKWSRNWQERTSNTFLTNIENFDFKGKNIMIMEDVIATGETLYNIYKKINEKGGNTKLIVSAIINEGSSLLERSFANTVVSLKINGKKGEDPFWYPAIYSTRHLFYGDSEMQDFYLALNEKYFGGNVEIERSIKERRKR